MYVSSVNFMAVMGHFKFLTDTKVHCMKEINSGSEGLGCDVTCISYHISPYCRMVLWLICMIL
jgi:hypothetical protein